MKFPRSLCARLSIAILVSGTFSLRALAVDPATNDPATTSAGVTGSPTAASTVVDPAPPFTGGADAGKKITLASLRGSPVLLVIAPSPRDHAFRRQMKELRGHYERLAAQGLICFAALTAEGGRIPSNIPFVLVNDPLATASAYDIQKGFAIAVIGRDGNLDCLSTRPLPGYRINDLIINNAAMQTLLRR